MDLQVYKDQNRFEDILPFKHTQVQLGVIKPSSLEISKVPSEEIQAKLGAEIYSGDNLMHKSAQP